MNTVRLSLFVVLIGLIAGTHPLQARELEQAQESLNRGKILIFDRKLDEAIRHFEGFIREFPDSHLVPQAYFYKGRCLQLQGRESEAVAAYEEFLRKYPAEPVLPSQAKNSIVEIAASMFERGDPSLKDRLTSALTDADKEVRYFAAFRCSQLRDDYLQSMVVPILREILRNEDDRDLVDRAKLRLLRLDPDALSESIESRRSQERTEKSSETASGETKMFHLVVYVEGDPEPKVELNIPVAFAKLALQALDESTKREIRRKGIDIENIWETLNRMGPTDVLTFRDGGNVVKLWIK